jgi:hypothetical protein
MTDGRWHRYICAQGEQPGSDVHVAEALGGGAAEGSYEQEAAAVEDGEEMEREDAEGIAKRPGPA